MNKISSNLELHPKCKNYEEKTCERIREGFNLCSIYLEPCLQWTKIGGCAGRTHVLPITKEQKPRFINPLKQSKRGKR